MNGDSGRRAFNLGSDARIDGVPLNSNPYPSDSVTNHIAWRMGWLDVSENWGKLARWPIRSLPAISAVA
jgi:hypothetical protein